MPSTVSCSRYQLVIFFRRFNRTVSDALLTSYEHCLHRACRILSRIKVKSYDRRRSFAKTLLKLGIFPVPHSGIKTYTVFAPTDAAFAHLSTEELTNLVTEKDQAEELVRKHVVPGTLFTAGMRFYQVKDVMAEGKTVTLQKTGGTSQKELYMKLTNKSQINHFPNLQVKSRLTMVICRRLISQQRTALYMLSTRCCKHSSSPPPSWTRIYKTRSR